MGFKMRWMCYIYQFIRSILSSAFQIPIYFFIYLLKPRILLFFHALRIIFLATHAKYTEKEKSLFYVNIANAK